MSTVSQFQSKNRETLLKPVSKKTLADEVVAILKRFILANGLHAGDQLPPERSLAASLGVSHRVIREALSVLSGEGIVSKEQGRGVFLNSFDPESLQAKAALSLPVFERMTDSFEVRCALEVGVASIAARHATEEDIAELQAIIDEMTPKHQRGESMASEEIRFHLALLRATHNETLQQLEHLLMECIRFKMYHDPNHLSQSKQNPKTIQEHQAIVDALRTQDSLKAMFEMFSHQKRLLDDPVFRQKNKKNR